MISITLTPDEQRALLAAIHGAIDDAEDDHDTRLPLASVESKIRNARREAKT